MPPDVYLHARFDLTHDHEEELLQKVFYDFDWYIIYQHFKKDDGTPKEHFHVLCAYKSPACEQRVRDRIAKLYNLARHQKGVGRRENGVLRGIQYCGHENTRPKFKGDECEGWIAEAPPWVDYQTPIAKKRKLGVLSDDTAFVFQPQVTEENFIQYMLAHYRRFGERIANMGGDEDTFKNTFRDMIRTGKYVFMFGKNFNALGYDFRLAFYTAVLDITAVAEMEGLVFRTGETWGPTPLDRNLTVQRPPESPFSWGEEEDSSSDEVESPEGD